MVAWTDCKYPQRFPQMTRLLGSGTAARYSGRVKGQCTGLTVYCRVSVPRAALWVFAKALHRPTIDPTYVFTSLRFTIDPTYALQLTRLTC